MAKLYKLTITKVSDRKGLANSLRDLYCLASVSERLKIVDNLPFVDDKLYTEPSHIEKVLSKYCEYYYEEIPFPGNENACTPPWESPQYLEAKKWYNTLSENDRRKIDILVQANVPWG